MSTPYGYQDIYGDTYLPDTPTPPPPPPPPAVTNVYDSLVIAGQIELLGGPGGVQSTLPGCIDPASGTGAIFHLQPGYDLGDPQPTTAYVGSLLLDGERPFGYRASNRVITLPVNIEAPTFSALAGAKEALMQAIDQQEWTLTWTRGAYGDPAPLPLVFDCFRAQPSQIQWGSVDQMLINPVAAVTITVQALPYGRSDQPVQVSVAPPLPGFAAPPAPVLLDTMASVSGAPWARLATGPGGSFSAYWNPCNAPVGSCSGSPGVTATYSAATNATYDITGCSNFTFWLGLGTDGVNYYKTWNQGPVNTIVTLTDAAGTKLVFNGTKQCYQSNASLAPRWNKITLPIPQVGLNPFAATILPLFDYTQVTHYSVEIYNFMQPPGSSQKPAPSTRYTHVYVNAPTAAPPSQLTSATLRGSLYQILGVLGTARTPINVQAQQAGLTKTDVFTTPGPFTWTAPVGLSGAVADVTAIGAGGAGGSVVGPGEGGGGGGGEAAREVSLAVTAGASYSGVVGAGGTPQTGISTLTVTTLSLPGGQQGAAYSSTLAATGGTTTGYAWSITSGTLPPGLALGAATGLISGTPTTAGSYGFTVQVADDGGDTDPQPLTITISGSTLAVVTASLPNAVQGTAYTTTLAASGGTGSYTWSVTVGSLPAGLALTGATGVISGTPTGSGTSSFTVQVTDSSSATATAALSIVVSATATLTITTTSLAAATVGTAYSATLTGSGGTGTGYAWSVSVGTLPAGLALNTSTGVISGTPTTAATSSFTVKLADSGAHTATQALSIVVNPQPLNITTLSLAAATVGTAYSTTLAATGGTPPYTWLLISGTLPAGLALNTSTGVISGTPTTAGTSSFTIKATDSAAATDSQALSILVNAVGATSLPMFGTANAHSLGRSGTTLGNPTFTPIYDYCNTYGGGTTQLAGQWIVWRGYAGPSSGMPTAWNSFINIPNTAINCTVYSWKPPVGTVGGTTGILGGQFDTQITSWGKSCQQQWDTQPGCLYVTFWHEGEDSTNGLTSAQILNLHAYVYPRFKAACRSVAKNGASLCQYGQIFIPSFLVNNASSWVSCPATVSGGSVLDFYGCDGYTDVSNLDGSLTGYVTPLTKYAKPFQNIRALAGAGVNLAVPECNCETYGTYARVFSTAKITKGSTTLTDTANGFVAADVGNAVNTWNVAPMTGAATWTTIVSVTDAGHAVMSSAATASATGQFCCISTPKGRASWFWELWDLALGHTQTDGNSYRCLFVLPFWNNSGGNDVTAWYPTDSPAPGTDPVTAKLWQTAAAFPLKPLGVDPAPVNGGDSWLAGDSVTAYAHGGASATSAAGAAGGTGSVNTVAHPGGAGATGSASSAPPVPYTVINVNQATVTATPKLPVASATSVGDTLAVWIANNVNIGLNSVTDSRGNNWSVVNSEAPGNPPTPQRMWLYQTQVSDAAHTYTTRAFSTGATTNLSTTLADTGNSFTAADLGKLVTGANIPVNTTISAITDTGHVVMSAAATATASGVNVTISDYIAPVFASVGTGFQWAVGRGVNGLALSGVVDQAPAGTTGTSTSPSTGPTATLAQASEYAIAAIMNPGAGGSPVWGGGFTQAAQNRPATSGYLTVAEQLTSATSPLTASATITSTTWIMAMATFVQAPVAQFGGGGGASASAAGPGGAGSGSNGGAAPAGGGGGGAGSVNTTTSPAAGLPPGGGGGGQASSLAAAVAAAGADGQVAITRTTLGEQFSTLILHHPGQVSWTDNLNYQPLVTLGTGTDVPNGSIEYLVPSPQPGLNAQFKSTYSVIAVAGHLDSPGASRSLTIGVKQYDYVKGPSHNWSVTRTFTPTNDISHGIVTVGEITLPISALASDNTQAYYTITVSDDNTSDTWLDVMFLDTQGETVIINDPATRDYAVFYIDAPSATSALGNILGSDTDRSAATSVISKTQAVSGGPLSLLPGDNVLFAYAVEGAPQLGINYFPRWWNERLS